MARLPRPGSDEGQWGDVLNDFLSVELNGDGSLKKTQAINQAISAASTAQQNAAAAQATAQNAQTLATSSYVKPASGIPETDLSSAVQTKISTSQSVAADSIDTSKIAATLANLISLSVYRRAQTNPNWVSNTGVAVDTAALHAQGFSLSFWCEPGLEPVIGTANGQAKEGRDSVYQINIGA